jgi:hypothetical protein
VRDVVEAHVYANAVDHQFGDAMFSIKVCPGVVKVLATLRFGKRALQQLPTSAQGWWQLEQTLS